ncbi:hypothetical protein ACFOWU_04215 [Epilithonimonas zeae]|uniref:Plasmid mobilization relaxosome protein MobC n=1 Tax=Epilithonimonas zeae TaxID=1416779 RepID=A0A1N6EW05_9FLAO|nr:hypothetical protein [Epilithonimonas zeae]SIN87235.1 hypothetical protein SAMN05444409_0890 [Epilithonimonas zeae]
MEKKDSAKEDFIVIRIQKSRKDEWKRKCLEKKISLSSLIVNSVENRLQDNERREILEFIEKQDNIFIKIETNINQVAKIANNQKFIRANELQRFSELLVEVVSLKQKQNKILERIYSLLSK